MTNNPNDRCLKFRKMHGLGNDFIIFDGREDKIDLSEKEVRLLADRRIGIGCDQLITLQHSDKADALLHIQNSDGSSSESCGNGTRCAAAIIMAESGYNFAEIDSLGGLLHCKKDKFGISVDMGKPHFGWAEIPLSEDRDTLNLGLRVGALHDPVAVNVGNPHVIFFVEDAEKIDLPSLGPVVENYPLFPERVNVNVAQIIDQNTIRLRVWERGTGITRACGTGACATLVAAHKKGLTDNSATIILDGGDLQVDWTKEKHIMMTGAAALSFEGEVNLNSILHKARDR